MVSISNGRTVAGPPQTSAEKRELRHTYPLIAKQLALLQGTEWGAAPWDTAGLTWHVKHMLAPLGQTAAAVVTYRGRRSVPGTREILQLPLQWLYPRISDGRVYYDDVDHTHELGLVAFPGARGKILDADVPISPFHEPVLRRKVAAADVAMELLRQQKQFASYDVAGDAAPQLPHILVGFSKPGAAHLAGTPAKRAAAKVAGVAAEMTDDELQQLLKRVVNGKTVLELLCNAPNTNNNPTAKWLVPQEYLTYISDNVPVYEDFTSLCGVEVCNPARLACKTIRVANPVRLAAVQTGVDLNGLLAQLDMAESSNTGHVGRGEAMDITDACMELIVPMRRLLGRLSKSFSDDALLSAILYPKRALEQLEPVTLQSDAEKLDFGFGFLAVQYPHLIGRVTEADMLAAFANPYRQLYARHACIVQHIQLDENGHARYGSQQLGRPRVSMDCL